MPAMANQVKNALAKYINKYPYKTPIEVINYLDPTRFVLREDFKQKPALNAVLDTTGASSSAALIAYTIANKDFEVLGTNMTTALVTFDTAGGITLTTAGASADQAIVTPHLDTNQTQWQTTLWPTTGSITFDAVIVTGASVASTTIWAGFKLTNTSVVATDDDQVFFRYNAATNSGGWQIIHSRANTDSTRSVTSSEVAVVAASTKYRLRIALNAARQFRAWINDYEVKYLDANSVIQPFYPALTTAINLIPYIGVQATAVAAKAISVRGLICSRI